MPVHPVLRTDGQALEVPGAQQRLLGTRLGPAAVHPQGLDQPGHLGGRRDVGDEDPAGRQRPPHGLDAVPGGEHVEHHRIDIGQVQGLGEVAEREGPVARTEAVVLGDVGLGDGGELLAQLVAVHLAAVAHGANQGAGQGTGPHARLHHPGAGPEVGQANDARGVLGVDDLGPAGHGQDEVVEDRPQGQVGRTVRGGHDDALGPADEVVVGQAASVRVELPARRQGDRVQATARIGQLDEVTGLERAAAPRGGKGLGHVAERY